MEVAELDEALKIIDSCVSQIKWRLKAASRRRLHIDILGLCTGLRPVVMVDYGGKMPELQENLCSILQLSQKDSASLKPLRVMIIEDMIYLIHVKGLAEYVKSSLNSEVQLQFVDLEEDPPKIIVHSEENLKAVELVSVQRFFSTVFPADGMGVVLLPSASRDHVANDNSPVDEIITSQSSSDVIDLSSCMQDCQVTIPTLNGWLLGYPVVYLFGKDHISDAIYNLSTKYLNLFQVLIRRNVGTSSKGGQQEELMSFSVPYSLSMGGEKEPWAESFLVTMLAKLEPCKQIWASLQMEVSECYPQAIAL